MSTMSMTASPTSAALREQARERASGRFGFQHHSTPEVGLAPSVPGPRLTGKAAELEAFIARAGHRPRSVGTAEAPLRRWVRRAIQSDEAGFRAQFPQWDATPEYLDSVAHDIATVGRTPRDKRHAKHHAMLVSLRDKYDAHEMTEEQAAELDKLVDDWWADHIPTGAEIAQARADEAFAAELENVAAYLREFGRLPTHAPTETDAARALGRWLGRVRKGAKGSTDGIAVTAERRAQLDAVSPDILGNSKSHEERFEERAAEYEAWVQAHGREPRRWSGDDVERNLGHWKHGTAAQRAVGEVTMLRMSPIRRERWEERLSQVAQCANTHGRLPSQEIPDEVPGYSWLVLQRRYERQGRLPQELAGMLDAAVPGWRGKAAAR